MRRVVSVVVAALLCVLAAASQAYAADTIGCEHVWSKSSSSNDLLSCITNKKRMRTKAGTLVMPALSVVLLAITVLVLPWFLCCRCCCLRCTPTSGETMARARLWLFMWILLALLMSIGACVLLITGSKTLTDSLTTVVSSLRSITDDYFMATANEVAGLLSDPNNYAPEMATFDAQEVPNKMRTLKENVVSGTAPLIKYNKVINGVLIALGLLVLVLTIVLMVIACCRCVRCMPIVLSVVFLILAIAFGVLSIVVTFVMPLTGQMCNELKQQRERAPGILQWYAVPMCDDQFGLSGIRADLVSQSRTAANKGCTELLKYCNGDGVYDENNVNVAFMCGDKITKGEDCTSLDKLIEVVKKTEVKDDLKTTLCSPTRTPEQYSCTLPDCASVCTDYKDAGIEAKTRASELMNKISFVENATLALTIVKNFLDCDYVIDVVSGPLVGVRSNPKTGDIGQPVPATCVEFATSSIIVGVGCFVALLTCMLSFCILQRGRFVWGTTIRVK